MAALTPIAGAPRITIVLMALATSFTVLQMTYVSVTGNLRWSTILMVSPSQATVGSM